MLLTRSPLGHLPEGRASLDLHVLSTPPAFVLSQDQTLRECLYDYPVNRGCRHRKSPSLRRLQSLVHTSWVFHLCDSRRCNSFARCTKGISSTSPASRRHRRELINGTNFRHAVEFSRSGRTPSRSFRTGQGQPWKCYSVGSARSNLTGSARFPLGRRTRTSRGASHLGDIRPAPPGLAYRSPGGSLVAPCAEQGED